MNEPYELKQLGKFRIAHSPGNPQDNLKECWDWYTWNDKTRMWEHSHATIEKPIGWETAEVVR